MTDEAKVENQDEQSEQSEEQTESRDDRMKVYNLVILDDSASMRSVTTETIDGLNAQIDSMIKSEEDGPEVRQIVCLVTFGTSVNGEEIWKKPISDLPRFSSKNYSPDQGGTALYDGIGLGVTNLYNDIREELDGNRANVICTIFTDGGENASRRYTGGQIASLIEELQGTGKWTFSFCGCESNCLDVADSLNIRRGNTMQYARGGAGTTQAFAAMADARYTRSVAYSEAVSKGESTADINDANFFDNMELDQDPSDTDK